MELVRLFRSWRARASIIVVISVVATACGQAPASIQAPGDTPQPRPLATAATVDQTATPALRSEATPTIQAEVVAGVTAVATPAPTVDDAGAVGLRQSIMGVLSDLNGEWGIGIEDLKSGETFAMNAGRQYPAASLYKLVLLAEAYQRIEDGSLALDQVTRMLESDYSESLMWDEELKIGDKVSVKGLLRVLIIQSSNAAAHALERLMNVRSVNETARRIGLSQTHMPTADIRARYDDWRAESTATSVGDLTRFFGMLYRGQLVSPDASRQMLELLKQQQINDRIPALLPKGVAVAHKTGNLPGVVADAGIIFGPATDVILVVLNDGADHDQATEAIGKIAKIVYLRHNAR